MEFVEARRAKPGIKKCLMRGGSCTVKVGDVTRMLHHSFLDRPPEKLPWPFSGLQAHDVHYVESEGNDIKVDQVFSKGKIDQAITLFLRDLAPSESILVYQD